MTNEGLRIGMFLGGLLMALVPISITVGFGIWALKQRQQSSRDEPGSGDPSSHEGAA